ncbi:chitinase [Xenorhabdus budapestensis]|uniref:chitinase n=1 Tax=Xenorhabdus budapestensis TaxID=290110 RepID=A0A8A7FKN8_XENBU|nr:glycosyl hydrolase family 18 protein [Xenorhabdus budapestensis]QSI99333.1 chitinase 2 [Xenorhabdus budapestensis]QTL38606.1 chitinase [Xenorhabdus budapestensis]
MDKTEKNTESNLVYSVDPGYQHEGALKGYGKEATQKTYALNNYDPAASTDILTYTSTRMAKTVFNTYEDNDDFSIACYFTDWAQYDARAVEPSPPDEVLKNQGGRGADLTRVKGDATNGSPFKKLIFSFVGIIGDKGPKKDTILSAAAIWGFGSDKDNIPESYTGWPIPIDPWADVSSFFNCGFKEGAGGIVAKDLYDQEKAKGLLGGFRELKKTDPNLEISVSIGGWSMSGAFYDICRDDIHRKQFVEGLKDLFNRFPMFNHIDIDWEYPGSAGMGNQFDKDDYIYYKKLIEEIKAANISNLKGISIAASGDPEKIDDAHIPELIAAGVTGINLMTYDFFTLGDGQLSHHTNLYRNKDDKYSKYSVDDAVQHLIKLGIDEEKIFIGYSGYTRNAKGATINNQSPLQGTYTGSGNVVGSFESAVIEWTDVIYNYVDFENGIGRNGYEIIHDEIAQADYLYNEKLQVFMSLDTPRSVREKARYVKEKGLGGLFIWSGDQDNGLLTNAAHEGLGRKVKHQIIDMSPFYFDDDNLPSYDKPKEPQCKDCV